MDYLKLPLSGLEPPLGEMEQMVQDNVHHFRDARSSMVADGLNEMLAMEGGTELINPDLP